MTDSTTILENMRALSVTAAANVGDPITTARINGIPNSGENFVQAQDGFHGIEFDDNVGDAAFIVEFDSASNVMTLRNLTSGEISSVTLGATAIALNETQVVNFDGLGATITLNSAFDKTADIDSAANYSATAAGGTLDEESVAILSATSGGSIALTSNVVNVDATTANSATLSIGDYSASGIDLTEPDLVTASLSDGTDVFTIEFVVTTAYSDTDAGGLEIDDLGAMIFAVAGIEPAPVTPTLIAEFSRVDTTLNSLSGADNRLEQADGIESISFDASVQDAAMLVSYDATTRALQINNLTAGLTQAVNVGNDIADGATRTISFADLGVTVVLNDDFDANSDIARKGADVTPGGGGEILQSSFQILNATSEAGLTFAGTSMTVDGTTANTATLTIDGFSAAGVDLSRPETTTATLTDGTDSFTVSFVVSRAFSDSDTATIDFAQVGQLVFADPVLPMIQRGGDLAEVFAGTVDDDIAFAGGGDDVISGAGGADDLRGQDGDDTLSGDAGEDSLFGGVGDDDLTGGDDADMLRGGGGIDTLDGGTGADRLYGDDGADVLTGGAGADLLKGGAGADIIRGDDDADEIFGGAGDDTISGGAGDDVVFGGDGEDDIDGGDGADEIFGEGDADDLEGGAGNDLIVGGGDADTIAGGDDNDTLNGNAGDDVIDGDAGNDRLRGGSDDDVLDGGAGADSLFGDNGIDILIGGAGADFLKGGAGADIFRYIDGAEGDRIADYEDGVDRIDFSFHSGANALGDLTIEAINGGADTRITITAEGTNANAVIVSGVDSSLFDGTDFIF